MKLISKRFVNFYARNYKKLFVIPILFALFAFGVILNHKLTTGEWFDKDVDFKGGVVVTVDWNNAPYDMAALTSKVSKAIGVGVSLRPVKSYDGSKTIALSFEAPTGVDPDAFKKAVIAATQVPESAVGIKTVGPAMSERFMKMAQIAILLAFVMMGIIVYFTFKTPIVVFTVVSCVILDIVGAAASLDLFHIPLSQVTLGALLMMVGYSIDTDTLITTALLRKHEGKPLDRAMEAMDTGLATNLTSGAPILILYLFMSAPVIKNLALVLLVGLVYDSINTWFTNLGALLWYTESKRRVA